MPPRVAVVIPSWNTREFLGPCLESLRRQTFRDFETIVVDSASTDGSVGFVRENFPEVRTLALPENRGFSGAVNARISASNAELVVLLNNDTEQDPGWLQTLVEAAERRPEAGLFASKLVDFRDRRRLDGAGDALRGRGSRTGSGTGRSTAGSSSERGSSSRRARRRRCTGARSSRT